jgi:beta-phosphoglucomutase
MPAFDAILFDFDGVLVDSEPLHFACWAEVLAPFGIKLTWEFYRDHYLGMDDRDMLSLIASEASPPVDWQTLWTRYPAKKVLFQRKMEQPPFLPELPKLLEKLHRDYKLAVVSTSARVEIEPPLHAGKLREYFDALVTGQDVERRKPAPDPYLLGARLLGARRPLVVEDSPTGIASGRAAGFEVLHVTSASAMPAALVERLSRGLAPA